MGELLGNFNAVLHVVSLFLFLSMWSKKLALEKLVNTLKSALENRPQSSSLTKLEEELTAAQTKITSAKNVINDLETKLKISNQTVLGLQGKLSSATANAKSELHFQTQAKKISRLELIVEAQLAALEKLANRFINDSLKFICSGITEGNYASSVTKAEKVFEFLRKNKTEFPKGDEVPFYGKIKEVYENEVRKGEARREQQLIKERIREEQRAEREKEQEIRKLEKDTAAIALALDEARKQFNDEHASQVEDLKRQLADAQAKAERAKSQAQLTKAGFVYVISNIGSLGEKILKVGMTRRLDPADRIKELGDASVPFPFDVHMMISTENAPRLETDLHRELHQLRVNKVNLHKEFFKVDIATVAALVEKHHGKVEYQATPDAFEYSETQEIEKRQGMPDYDESQEIEDEEEGKAA